MDITLTVQTELDDHKFKTVSFPKPSVHRHTGTCSVVFNSNCIVSVVTQVRTKCHGNVEETDYFSGNELFFDCFCLIF